MPRKRQATPDAAPFAAADLRWLRKREVWGGVVGLLGILSALALLSLVRGALGRALAHFWRSIFGWGAYPVVALVLLGAAWLLARERVARLNICPRQVLGFELLLAAALGLTHMGLPAERAYKAVAAGSGGGYVGWALAYILSGALGRMLAGLALVAVAAAGLTLTLRMSWPMLWFAVRQRLARLGERLAPAPAPPRQVTPRPAPQPRAAPSPAEPAPHHAAQPPTRSAPVSRPRRRRTRSASLPPLDVLAPAATLDADDAETRYHAQVIEETLSHFGVPAKVAEIERGPAVTLFGVEPGFTERKIAGGVVQRKVRVSRIAALSNDLALALAVPSLRIEAPLPGRPLVGIEVPNRKATMVNLRTVIESDAYRKIRSPLRVALGQGTSGRPAAADLAGMPHLLIAGATGSGKSVCINSLIACLLMENSPEALNLVLVDPKRVELTNYNGVPHLVAPVVVEIEETIRALRWLCSEMDSRYKAFSRLKVRNLEGYNAAVGRRKAQRMPYLVVFIDEMADLMMVAPDEVERSLCRLAQMGRATGIHLVVATQRPSVDVLTGLIKANFPARIAFAVSTQIDSRVILDSAGAEQLLGRGDMLFMSPEASRLLRLQGCFVSDTELAAIVRHWREATEEAAEGAEDEEEDTAPPWEGLLEEEDEEDGYYAQALELLRHHSQASASFLQRRLRIGYTRAARLIEQLEAEGVVGPDPGGGRPRPVLIEMDDGAGDKPADEEDA